MNSKEALELGEKVKSFGTIHSTLKIKDGKILARTYKCKYTHGYLYAVFVYFDDVPEKMVHLTSTEKDAVDRMYEIRAQLAA